MKSSFSLLQFPCQDNFCFFPIIGLINHNWSNETHLILLLPEAVARGRRGGNVMNYSPLTFQRRFFLVIYLFMSIRSDCSNWCEVYKFSRNFEPSCQNWNTRSFSFSVRRGGDTSSPWKSNFTYTFSCASVLLCVFSLKKKSISTDKSRNVSRGLYNMHMYLSHLRILFHCSEWFLSVLYQIILSKVT